MTSNEVLLAITDAYNYRDLVKFQGFFASNFVLATGNMTATGKPDFADLDAVMNANLLHRIDIKSYVVDHLRNGASEFVALYSLSGQKITQMSIIGRE